MNGNHKLFRVCVHVHALKRDDDDDGSSVKIQIKINSDSASTHPEAINPNTKMFAFKREFHANYFSAQRNINSAIFILPSRTKQHRKSSMMKADSKVSQSAVGELAHFRGSVEVSTDYRKLLYHFALISHFSQLDRIISAQYTYYIDGKLAGKCFLIVIEFLRPLTQLSCYFRSFLPFATLAVDFSVFDNSLYMVENYCSANQPPSSRPYGAN